MRPEDRDNALLWDMREAAREVLAFTRNVTYVQFEADKKLRYAVERQLLVVGEAAKRVSMDTKTRNQQVPWKSIVGLRNVLAHDYGEVLVERVWLVATEHIPELVTLLDPLIPSPPETDT